MPVNALAYMLATMLAGTLYDCPYGPLFFALPFEDDDLLPALLVLPRIFGPLFSWVPSAVLLEPLL